MNSVNARVEHEDQLTPFKIDFIEKLGVGGYRKLKVYTIRVALMIQQWCGGFARSFTKITMSGKMEKLCQLGSDYRNNGGAFNCEPKKGRLHGKEYG